MEFISRNKFNMKCFKKGIKNVLSKNFIWLQKILPGINAV